MTYRGRVKNGVIVLDDPLDLPEGTAVEIVPVTVDGQSAPCDIAKGRPRNLYDALGDLIGSIDDLPEDASENVDHYLYGAPKK